MFVASLTVLMMSVFVCGSRRDWPTSRLSCVSLLLFSISHHQSSHLKTPDYTDNLQTIVIIINLKFCQREFSCMPLTYLDLDLKKQKAKKAEHLLAPCMVYKPL